MSGSRRRWVWSGLLIWVAVVAGVLAYLFHAKDRGLAGTVIQAVAAVVALAIPGTLWLWRARVTATVPAVGGLNQAADALADAVRAQWETQAGERLLRYPAPVPVRWRWSTLPVTGATTDAVSGGNSRGFAPLPGLPAVTTEALEEGELADLLAVYAGVDSGRLLVIGAPGAGKSGAAIMLLLDALAYRTDLDDEQRRRTPVPVMFTPHDWDPITQPVGVWLAERLRAIYPFLKATEYGPDAAAALVRDGRVALLLDGLDELPEAVRPAALQALDEQVTGMRLVVLTRSQEMVAAAAVRRLHRAAAVELQPVPPAQAADYLARCHVHPAPAYWQRLVDHVRSHPDSLVTQSLDSPLMLGLVRDTLSAGEEVDALLAPGRFTSREEVEDELLDRVLPAAYASRPGRSPARYDQEQARRWLGYLADRMRQDSTRDLAWWRIPTWAAWIPRILATILVTGLIVGPASWIAFGITAGFTSAPVFGGLVGAVVGFAFGAAVARGGRPPQQLGSPRWSAVDGRRLATDMGVSLGMGVVVGAMAGWSAGLPTGLTVGLLAGFGAWIALGVEMFTSHPSANPGSPIDPITCWRLDRRHGRVMGLAFGLALGISLGVGGLFLSSVEIDREVGGASAVAVGGAVGIAAAIAGGLVYSETWATGLALLQLRRRGGVPLRLMDFLEDARARHVLRTAGPVYQFRHARLQDRLADHYTGTHEPAAAPSRVPAQRDVA